MIQERRPRTLPCQDETWKVLCWQDYERASLMSQRLLLRHLEFVLCLILRPSTLGKVKLLFVKIDGPCYNTLSLHGPLYCPHHTLVLILLPLILSDIEAQPENLKFEFFKDSKTTGNLTWDAACSEEFLPVVCYFWKMVKFQNVDIHLIFSTLYIIPDVILDMLDVYTCTSILKGWFTFSPIVNSAW